MSKRKRLDLIMVSKGLAPSRQQAQAMIVEGKVLVNSVPVLKPASQVTPDCSVVVQGDPLPFVSRGGLKLEHALITYQISVTQLTCMDIGASTGGFTDCLLQNGAGHVYAIDVGYGQLAWKLRQDPKVSVIERMNIRYLPETAIPGLVDLITIDTSFISLKVVLPAALKFLKPDGKIITLIKPQFEVGKGKVGKGGVVRGLELQREVLDDLSAFFTESGLQFQQPIPSPILGPKGNQEYLTVLSRQVLPD